MVQDKLGQKQANATTDILLILLDLVILLLAAFLIGSKLWSVLGTRPLGGKTGNVIVLKPSDVTILKKKPDFYPGFDEQDFLEGAEHAFHSILKAYYEKDAETLKKLVTTDLIHSTFSETPGAAPTTNCLVSAVIVHKEKDKKTARITVNFKGHQVVQKKNIETDDIWTFQRSLSSKNLNWTLCALGKASDSPNKTSHSAEDTQN